MAKDMYQKRRERQENKKDETYGEKKTNINWYPGHMTKTRKQIEEDLKLVDLVIELLDARIPKSSQNPDIENIIRDKKKIIILNKADLVLTLDLEKWVQQFKNNSITAIPMNSNDENNINYVIKQIENLMKDELEKQNEKGRIGKTIRVMVIGIPNVGKSSFINRLTRKTSAEVGNRPGVTKQKQWIRINNKIELLDTPGVLWPKFRNEQMALNLAYTGAIKDELLNIEEIAFSLLKNLYKTNKKELIERYNILETENILDLFIEIGKKRGALLKGGEVNFEKTGNIILNDFRTGKLGKIMIEKIEG